MLRRLFPNNNKESIEEYKARLDLKGFIDEPQVTAIKETKYKEKVLVYYSEKFEDYLKIRLYSGNNSSICFINLLFRDNIMDIADINVLGNENLSKGYGSVLMDISLSIARRKGVKTVTGILYSEDKNNRIRQKKYYTKYGFTIEGNRLRLDL